MASEEAGSIPGFGVAGSGANVTRWRLLRQRSGSILGGVRSVRSRRTRALLTSERASGREVGRPSKREIDHW